MVGLALGADLGGVLTGESSIVMVARSVVRVETLEEAGAMVVARAVWKLRCL